MHTDRIYGSKYVYRSIIKGFLCKGTSIFAVLNRKYT